MFLTVVSGMEVLEKIADAPTSVDPKLRASDVPNNPIVISKVTRLD